MNSKEEFVKNLRFTVGNAEKTNFLNDIFHLLYWASFSQRGCVRNYLVDDLESGNCNLGITRGLMDGEVAKAARISAILDSLVITNLIDTRHQGAIKVISHFDKIEVVVLSSQVNTPFPVRFVWNQIPSIKIGFFNCFLLKDKILTQNLMKEEGVCLASCCPLCR